MPSWLADRTSRVLPTNTLSAFGADVEVVLEEVELVELVDVDGADSVVVSVGSVVVENPSADVGVVSSTAVNWCGPLSGT